MAIQFQEFKKLFLYSLIGALITSAVVAVITILLGDFNETTGKVFLTLLMVVFHSLISLVFIWDDARRNTFEKLAFFTNVLFILIVLSFISSISGIWEIISGELVARLYATYFVLGFASLHSDLLSKTLRKESYLNLIVYSNFVFITLVVLLLLPIIYISDSFQVLGEVYFRFLGASGIIDGTLSILAIIFYRLYMHKHPEEQNVIFGGVQGGTQTQRKGLSIWIWILLIYLAVQVIIPIVFGFSSIVFSR